MFDAYDAGHFCSSQMLAEAKGRSQEREMHAMVRWHFCCTSPCMLLWFKPMRSTLTTHAFYDAVYDVPANTLDDRRCQVSSKKTTQCQFCACRGCDSCIGIQFPPLPAHPPLLEPPPFPPEPPSPSPPPPPRVGCKPFTPFDTSIETCMPDFCDENRAAEDCLFCRCKSCSLCSVYLQAPSPGPPPPLHRKKSPAPAAPRTIVAKDEEISSHNNDESVNGPAAKASNTPLIENSSPPPSPPPSSYGCLCEWPY